MGINLGKKGELNICNAIKAKGNKCVIKLGRNSTKVYHIPKDKTLMLYDFHFENGEVIRSGEVIFVDKEENASIMIVGCIFS